MSTETLTITQPELDAKTTTGIEKLERWAGMLTITTPDDRRDVAEICKTISQRKKAVVDYFADSKGKAHATWKAIVAQEKSITDRLDTIGKAATDAMRVYDRVQEEIRRMDQARLQAIEDEQARKERERLEKEAAKLKTPELKQQRMDQAAAVVSTVVEVAMPDTKADGEVKRVIWKAELTDIAALVKSAADGNGAAMALLAFDQVAANRMATATKGAIDIPGVRIYDEASYAFRQ